MKYLITKKIGMSQRFADDGTVTPVTVLGALPMTVVRVKQAAQEGYTAIQIGAGTKKKVNKAVTGQYGGLGSFAFLREFRAMPDDVKGVEKGAAIDVTTLAVGDAVKATGISKGRGFAGVVKRHHFAGAPATHGHKDQLRMPGAIGSRSYPGKVFKGKRMGGRMGGERVTVRNLTVVAVDAASQTVLVKGAVPGRIGGYVFLTQDLKR